MAKKKDTRGGRIFPAHTPDDMDGEVLWWEAPDYIRIQARLLTDGDIWRPIEHLPGPSPKLLAKSEKLIQKWREERMKKREKLRRNRRAGT